MGNIIVNVIERALAFAGLIVLSPAIALVSFLIWRVDGFPIFFRQPRMGLGGRPFELLKLRSMRTSNAGALITAGGDARITPVGRVIRKYKLDEIPQLINVLRGDMSLVGPRPEVERYVDLKDPLWQKVLSVRPGVTDLATLLCRDEESLLAAAPDPEAYYRNVLLPRKLSVSAAAIERRSLLTTVQILVITVLCSFMPSRFDAQRLSESVFGIRLATTPAQQ